MSTPRPLDPLERAIADGAVRALRRRAEALREKAAPGVTMLELDHLRTPVRVVTSEAAHAFRIAKDFHRIADELLEAESRA